MPLSWRRSYFATLTSVRLFTRMKRGEDLESIGYRTNVGRVTGCDPCQLCHEPSCCDYSGLPCTGEVTHPCSIPFDPSLNPMSGRSTRLEDIWPLRPPGEPRSPCESVIYVLHHGQRATFRATRLILHQEDDLTVRKFTIADATFERSPGQ